MIKRNNKGFTLLELLISIFILTTVIFVGYRVINKSTIDVKNQGNINQGQLTVNNMNAYLTKDLEQASSIALFLDEENIIDTSKKEPENLLNDEKLKEYLSDMENGDKFTYSYKIRFKDDEENTNDTFSRIYSVEIIKDDKGNCRYSVSRKETDGISISFITNEILKEIQLPFTIQGNSPYEVSLGYNGKNNKFEKYEFTVASRLYVADNTGGDSIPPNVPPNVPPDILPGIPEIPEDIDDKSYLCMGFWMMDASKYNPNGNLYTWIEKKGIYGKQQNNKKEFYIRADNDNGNSSKSNTYIKESKNSKELISVNNNSIPADKVKKIKIYVSPYTTVKQTTVTLDHSTFKGITDLQTNTKLIPEGNNYTLQGNEKGRWYEINFEYSDGSNKTNFVIDGILSIDESKESSGYALIVYGDKANESTDDSNNLDGDLIFEFTKKTDRVYMTSEIKVGDKPDKNNASTQNSQYNFTTIIKTDDQSRISRENFENVQDSCDENFKNIKGIELKLEGNITVPKFKIDNIMSNEISLPLSYKDKFYFKGPAQYGVRFNEVRFDNLKIDETGRIIIKLIY